MNSRERVTAYFRNQPTDRPPVGFWMHFPQESMLGEANVAAHAAYYHRHALDLVKIMSDGYFDYPNPVAKSNPTPEDWYAMRPLGPKSAFLREQADRVSRVRDALGDDRVALYSMFAPFTYLRYAAGTERMEAHAAENPEAVRYAMSIVEEDLRTLTDLLLREGRCDGLYFCLHSGEPDRFSEEVYRSLIAPPEKRVLSYAASLSDALLLHCCGWAGKPNRLSLWADYPGNAVNWAVHVEGVSLCEGRALFGGRPVAGGFDNRPTGVLATGSRDAVQAYARGLIDGAGRQGLLIGADCTLPSSLPAERIDWVLEAIS